MKFAVVFAFASLIPAGCVFDRAGVSQGPGPEDADHPDADFGDRHVWADAEAGVRPEGGLPFCGNGLKEAGEACDGSDFGTSSCTTLGYTGGVLTCTQDCIADDSGCTTCNNGILEPGEVCDGTDLGGATCQNQGFDSGELACTAACEFEFSGCTDCGNGVAEGGEECDGSDLNGQTCVTLGFTGGVLWCNLACRYDAGGCFGCGNGLREGPEECDGTDLGGASCESLGHDGGALGCSPSCYFDDSGCYACGDGLRQGPEPCDGTDLGGATCQSLGHDGGSLLCDGSCQFDQSGCSDCGNGVVEGGEQCDDGANNSDTTPDACRTNCVLPWCGDSVCDSAEEGFLCRADCRAVVFADDFEGSWPGLWQVGDNDGGWGTDTWGQSSNRSHSPSHSCWCAAVGTHLTGGYSDNMQSWAIHPVDLGPASGQEVEVALWIWHDTDETSDFFTVIWSPDNGGNWFEVERMSQSSSGWIYRSYDFTGQAGNGLFWIGLYFQSDGWSSNGGGAYVDDLMIVRIW